MIIVIVCQHEGKFFIDHWISSIEDMMNRLFFFFFGFCIFIYDTNFVENNNLSRCTSCEILFVEIYKKDYL